MPMPPRGKPDWSNATPERMAISSNLPVALVVEEEVLDRVVGHGDVDQAIAVDVVGGHAQRLAHRHLEVGRADLDAGRLADVGEPAAVVAQERAERAAERGRRPVSPADAGELKPLDLVDLGRPGDVVADEEIEIAVVVDVEKRRAGEPAVGSFGVGRRGDVVEVSLAVVAEEIAAADGRHVEIGVAVVVVVAHGHALAVKRLVEPGLLGDVLEVSLAVVAVEGLGGRRLDFVAGPVRRVDEKQVLVAVAVVVEKGHARAHRLGQELVAEGAVVVHERDARVLGDVDELDGWAASRP